MKKQKRVFTSRVMRRVVRGVLILVLCGVVLTSQAGAQDVIQNVVQNNVLKNALKALRITVPQQSLPAPNFTLMTLDGKTLHLSDYRGKVVLLNFWASFCAPCLEEMPALEALWQEYRDQGFVVLAVAADRGSVDPVRDFVKAGNYSFPIPLDSDGDVRNQYEVRALPTTYLIGRDGRFVGRVLGEREWSSEKGRELVWELLH
jgi:peroxiredoxin